MMQRINFNTWVEISYSNLLQLKDANYKLFFSTVGTKEKLGIHSNIFSCFTWANL